MDDARTYADVNIFLSDRLLRVQLKPRFYLHFEFLAEVLLMKLVNSLDIAENDISLAAQGLRNVFAQ